MSPWRVKADTVMQYIAETSVIIHDDIAFSLAPCVSNYVFLANAQRRVIPFFLMLFFGRVFMILDLNMLRFFAAFEPEIILFL